MIPKTFYASFVDQEDGGDRESWSVFYTPFFVDETQAGAEALAKAYITSLSVDDQQGLSIHTRKAGV